MPVKRSARASKTIKRDSVATENEVDHVLCRENAFDEIILGVHDDTSDASDYNDKRRKLSATQRGQSQKKRRPRRLTLRRISRKENEPAPAMSDNDYDTPSDMGTGLRWLEAPTPPALSRGKSVDSALAAGTAVQHDSSTPNFLQIRVDAKDATVNPVINIDLTPLLRAHASGLPLLINSDGTNISPVSQAVIPVNAGEATPPSLRLRRLTQAKTRQASPGKPKLGFIDLPYEIRIRIHRFVFVTHTPITFLHRKDFRRSASFLRTCKTVHKEAPTVLYGENTFHFERNNACRGRFFEEDWQEIGFKDVRRFLETIGTKNLSMMRYISFDFTDATRLHTSNDSDRRFVNDPVVRRCLELIGWHTHLSKFAFTCTGRRNVVRNDTPFLRALASVKAEQVTNPPQFHQWSRIKPDLVADLLKLMVVTRHASEDVDEKKIRPSTVVMHHEYTRGLFKKCTR